jgi:hypothetical protein
MPHDNKIYFHINICPDLFIVNIIVYSIGMNNDTIARVKILGKNDIMFNLGVLVVGMAYIIKLHFQNDLKKYQSEIHLNIKQFISILKFNNSLSFFMVCPFCLEPLQ